MTIETIEFAPGYSTPRVLRGCWQLAGGHGPVDRERVIEEMIAAARAGFTTLDCADAYTGVEPLIGEFRDAYRNRCGEQAAAQIKVHTKYLPDADSLATLTRADVTAAVDRSLQRLKQDRLDMLQFHWWDYSVPRHVEVAQWLDELRQAGKIRLLGSTNFDVPHLRDMVDAGVPIVATQIQYSLLDRRAETGMVDFCKANTIHIIAFGTVGGGLISEKYRTVAEPEVNAHSDLGKAKYHKIIKDFGGWPLFQELLEALASIAAKHDAGIAAIATRYMLSRPRVGAVALGARSGDVHLRQTLKLFDIKLDTADYALLDPILARRTGPSGDIWQQERDPTTLHGFSGRPYSRDDQPQPGTQA